MKAAPRGGPVADAEALELTETPRGTRLRLRVRAGGRSDAIVGVHGGALKLTVTAAPERGKANRAVVALLAERLGIPVSEIEIVAGTSSPDKVVQLALDRGGLVARLRGD